MTKGEFKKNVKNFIIHSALNKITLDEVKEAFDMFKVYDNYRENNEDNAIKCALAKSIINADIECDKDLLKDQQTAELINATLDEMVVELKSFLKTQDIHFNDAKSKR